MNKLDCTEKDVSILYKNTLSNLYKGSITSISTTSMSDKSTILRAFNAYFYEFFDFVIAASPEDVALRTSKKNIETVRSANPITIIRVWKTRICAPYAKELAVGDISFFDEVIASESMSAAVKVLLLAVTKLDEVGKKSVVQFLQNLSGLANRY